MFTGNFIVELCCDYGSTNITNARILRNYDPKMAKSAKMTKMLVSIKWAKVAVRAQSPSSQAGTGIDRFPRDGQTARNGQICQNGQNGKNGILSPKSAHPSFPNSFGPKMLTGPILGLSKMAKMTKMAKMAKMTKMAKSPKMTTRTPKWSKTSTN